MTKKNRKKVKWSPLNVHVETKSENKIQMENSNIMTFEQLVELYALTVDRFQELQKERLAYYRSLLNDENVWMHEDGTVYRKRRNILSFTEDFIANRLRD